MFVVVESMASALLRNESGLMFKDLDQLNIYDQYPMDQSHFLAMLKARMNQSKHINLPENHRRWLEYTKKYRELSFDLVIRRSGGKR